MEVQYSAVAAKLKAMHADFLTGEDFDRLLEKTSVNEICGYLKATKGYGALLADIDERSTHRGEIEIRLESELVDEYVRLYNFFDYYKREIMSFWFMRREVDFLKREIRYIYTHDERSKDDIDRSRFEAFFRTHTRINREIMREASSLADCAEACRNTPYWKPLKRAENLNADFFSIGMMLDSFHYAGIWKKINMRFDKSQKDLMKQYVGTKIDLMNLMWIYRGKKYFNFENEMIFAYLLPVRYRLTENMIRELVMANGTDSMIKAAEKTPYRTLFDDLDNGRFIEENYNYMIYKLSKKMFVNNTGSMAAVYAYLSLKELEIRRIVTIIEGIRYNQDPEIIRRHIIKKEEERYVNS